MKIAYVMCENKGRKKYSFTHGEIEFNCTWDEGEEHSELRQAIRANHPGKSIVSYCPAEMRNKMIDSLIEDNPDVNIVAP